MSTTTTFKKLRSGEWGVQGPRLLNGQVVKIAKRDGTITTAIVGKVIFTAKDGFSIATLAPKTDRHGMVECDECGERVNPGTRCWETGLTH